MSCSKEKWEKYRNQERCFIIGTGASLNDINLELLKNEVTIGCNYLFLKFLPKFLCFSDAGLYIRIYTTTQFCPLVRDKDIQLIMTDNVDPFSVGGQTYSVQVSETPLLSTGYFDENFQEVPLGRTVMFDLCFPLAYYLKPRNIYLLGIDGFVKYDKNDKREYTHFYGDTIIEHIPNQNELAKWAHIREMFESKNINIYNCSPKSAISVFEKRNYEDIFSR